MTHDEAETDLNSAGMTNNGADRAPDMSEADMFSSDVFSIPDTKPKKNIKARIGMVFILLSMVLIGVSFLFAEEDMPARPAVTVELPVAVAVESNALLPANEGALVYVHGAIDSPVQDKMFNHTENALSLERHVETYVWIKEGENYVKQWKEGIPENTEEQKQTGHENPAEMPIAGEKFNAERATMGAFKLAPELLAQLSAGIETSKINVTRDDFEKLNEYGQKAFKIFNFQFVFGKDPSQPEIGDFRIFYTAKPISANVSILAMQSGDGLVPYHKDGFNIAKMVEGVPDVNSLLADLEVPVAPVAAPVESDGSLGLYLKLGGVGVFVLGFLLLLASLSKGAKTPKPQKPAKAPKPPKPVKEKKVKKSKEVAAKEVEAQNVFDEDADPIPRGKMAAAAAAPVEAIAEFSVEEIDEDFSPTLEVVPSPSSDVQPAQGVSNVDEYGAMPEGVEVIGPDDLIEELPENPTLPPAPATEEAVRIPRSLEFTPSTPPSAPVIEELHAAAPVENVSAAQINTIALDSSSEEYNQLPEGVEIIGESYEDALPEAHAAMPVMEIIEETPPPPMEEEQLSAPSPVTEPSITEYVAEELVVKASEQPTDVVEAASNEHELPPLPPIPAELTYSSPVAKEVIVEEEPHQIDEVELPPLPPIREYVAPAEEPAPVANHEAPAEVVEERVEDVPEEIIEEVAEVVLEETELPEMEHPPLPIFDEMAVPEVVLPEVVVEAAPPRVAVPPPPPVHDELEDYTEIVVEETPLPEPEELPPLPVFDESAFEAAVEEEEEAEEMADIVTPHEPPPLPDDEDEMPIEVTTEEVSIDDLANSLRPDPHPIEEELALQNVKQSAIHRENASLEELIEDLTSDNLPPLPAPIFDRPQEAEGLEEIPTDMDDFAVVDDNDSSPFADEDEPDNK